MTGEKKIAVCRPHWSGFLGRIILCVIFLIVAISGLITHEADMFIAGLVLAAIFALSILISCRSTYLKLTETKLIGHIGFIKSRTLSTPLSRVQDISLSNGLFGKILGYHTIMISSAGTSGTEYIFRRMAKAKEFADAVQNAIVMNQ